MLSRLSFITKLPLFAVILSLSPLHAWSPVPPILLGDPIAQSNPGIRPHDFTPFNSIDAACYSPSSETANPQFERQVIVLVNQERAAAGLPPLSPQDALVQAGRYHATDMQSDQYFDHDSYDRIDDTLQWVCDWSTRLSNFYPDWLWLGENLAHGYTTPQDVVAAWMSSPGHRENILNPNFWEAGVGYASGEYWALDFGKPNGNYPLVINAGEESTSERAVNLYIYGNWEQVRLRNDADPWSEWMAFSNQLPWQLTAAAGEQRVFAEMRSASASAASSALIRLDSPTPLPQLGNVPAHLTFFYSTVSAAPDPLLRTIQPLNIASETPLDWEANAQGNWFTITPSLGRTPDTLEIIPTEKLTGTLGTTYQGVITFTVTAPTEALGATVSIPLNLLLIDTPVEHLFLPALSSQ